MVQSSLVGWWPLHEWSGRANDLSGNDNHGTVNGPAQGVAGVGGLTAYSFNGSSDEINVGAPSNSNNIYSASWWIRPRSVGDSDSDQIITFEGANGNLYMEAQITGDTNTLAVATNDSGNNFPTVSATVANKEWSHWSFVYNGSSQFLYRNGEVVDTNKTDNNGTATVGNYIGSNGGGQYFDGVISDVRVYNRALSPSEIQHLYEIGSVDVATPPNGNDANAVSRWSFDDRSDTTTALDSFGSNDGTINGATYSADSIRGLSMKFDNANSDEIDTGVQMDTLGMNDTGTASLWAKCSEFDSENHRFLEDCVDGGSSNHFQFMHQDQEVLLQIDDGTSTTTAREDAVGQDVWEHIVATWESSSGELTLYSNGVKIGTATGYGGSWSPNHTLRISGDGGFGGQGLDGNLDDIRLYDRVLSDYEVQQLYQWGTRGVDRRFEVLRQ